MRQTGVTDLMQRAPRRHGLAWMLLCTALALHVVDEAFTDFLSVYNPTVQNIRKSFPLFPLPVFTFESWLTGLIIVIILLFSLSPFVFRGARWMAPFSYLFGVLMLANGTLHLLGSLYLGRVMPGAISAPLLIAASVYLLLQTRSVRTRS